MDEEATQKIKDKWKNFKPDHYEPNQVEYLLNDFIDLLVDEIITNTGNEDLKKRAVSAKEALLSTKGKEVEDMQDAYKKSLGNKPKIRKQEYRKAYNKALQEIRFNISDFLD